MIEVLKHSALADDVAHAFRSHDLILADVLEGKGQARVLALHNPHLAEGALADDAQQAEVVEVDLVCKNDGLAIGIAHGV